VHRRIRDKAWKDSVMAGRGLGIWIAVFYVMPIILAIEGALQPRAAWQTVGQSRLLWIGVFVGGPMLSMVSGSVLPALGNRRRIVRLHGKATVPPPDCWRDGTGTSEAPTRDRSVDVRLPASGLDPLARE
jgi:hypothetical protein